MAAQALKKRLDRLEERKQAKALPPLPDMALTWDDGSIGWLIKDGKGVIDFSDGGPGEDAEKTTHAS